MPINKITKNNNVAGKAGPGRPKGAPNKTTAAIKDMVLNALDNVGGIKYLEIQAAQQPVAFMGLLAKIMPTQITGQDGSAIKIETIDVSKLSADALREIAGLEPNA
jgi:hypothetical protein